MKLENGIIINQYKIISSIGKGGMGEVFLAQDIKLNRKVALKILPNEFAEDKDRMSRFVREAQSVSALNHPNIITIHEIAESAGTHFIATEFIDGKTLNDYKKSNPLDYKSALEIAIQIASALDEAHHAGIVHRDIKPDNVMIRSNGLVKILDFGIAKLAARGESGEETPTAMQGATTPGMIIGTPQFMSPEQARGRGVDHQTDIFSFGVVLYEMLSGASPFAGETVSDVIAAVLTKEPPPLTNIPPELAAIVNKALQKDKSKRYQSAKELLDDLKEIKQDLEIQDRLKRSSASNLAEPKTQILKASTTAEENSQTVAPNLKSIAVLSFTNMSADEDNEYFFDGLAEELLNALSKIEDLKVAARTSAFSFKGKNANISEIGEKLAVKNILEGSVRKSGDKVRISVQLVNAADGYQLWSERYDREMKDIFDVQDEIALAVVGALKIKLFGADKADLLKRYTDNTEVYELYLKGRYFYNKYAPEDFQKGIEYFEQAIAIEPEYAPAYAGIGFCYGALFYFGIVAPREIVPKWRRLINKALEADDSLADAYLSRASIYFYYDWDFAAAERDYRTAIELNPNSPDARWRYGHFLALLRRFDEAVSEGEKALELDPLSIVARFFMARIYGLASRLDESFEQVRQIIEIEPNFAGSYMQLGGLYTMKGEYEKAAREYQKALSLPGFSTAVLSYLGACYGVLGNKVEAEKMLDRLLEMRKTRYVTPFCIARVYSGLGENDQAFEWFEKSFEERNGEMVALKSETQAYLLGSKIIQDPRFQDLIRRVGLPIQPTNEIPEAPTVMFSSGELKTEKTDDSKPINESIEINTAQTTNPQSETRNLKSKWRLFGLLGLLVIVGGFFGYKYFAPTDKQINSIAVLPFENRSGNPDSEYLADGLAESLIYRLSQLPDLKVSPTSSVFRYKGKETDAQRIANDLGVDTVMTGRMTQRGDNLTISVELVDVRNNRLLWGEQYERKMSELLQTQREIASEITGKLRLKLSGEGEQKLAKKYTDSPEAYQLYLKGRFYANKRTADGLKQSVEYYNQAIERDSKFALAFGGLAQSYVLLGFFGAAPPKDLMPKAKASAERALELDDSLAEAHAALGVYLCNFAWNLAAGEKEFRRAIELNPNYATAYHWLGNSALIGLKQFDEAIAAGRKAEELDPLSPVISADTGVNLYAAERFDEAIAQFDRALSLDPNFPFTHLTLGRVYDAQGKYAEAIREYRKALELDTDNPVTKGNLAASLAKSGNRRDALKILDELKAQAARGDFVPPMAFAALYIGLGEKDAAFAWMEKDFENRSYIPPYYPVIPAYQDLRGDSRFDELMRRVEAAKMD